ncbi:MAG: NUDIX hydrolase [Rickettsiaceae bacterium]|nr:NUDIX hydrolase [Rickettsiaceae bacterium]
MITELQALAQSGITYSKDQFDIERYKKILIIAAKLLSNNSNHKYTDVLELFTNDSGYATPKIDLRAAVFKNKKILLVKEKNDNLWSIPGGWADVNLSPSENIIKEIKEETGFDAVILKLIGIFDKRKNNGIIKWPHVYKIFFLCEINGCQSEYSKDEIIDINFFGLNNLPSLSKERVNEDQIQKCFAHYTKKDVMADFD